MKPYWGLRDYGLEQTIWDADPDCQHDWQEHHQPPRGGLNKFDNMPKVGANREMQKMSTLRGEGLNSQFCSKCGAWRGSLGGEPTPEMYVTHLVQIFEQVKRVLRPDGLLFVDIGDTYCSGIRDHSGVDPSRVTGSKEGRHVGNWHVQPNRCMSHSTIKPKDMVLIPFRLSIALQDAGWWIRSVIVWEKGNALPSAVKDRPPTSHEYVLMLSKSAHYYFDQDAIRVPHTDKNVVNGVYVGHGVNDPERVPQTQAFDGGGFNMSNRVYHPMGRKRRTVWRINTKPYPEAHMAVFPPALVEPMILAGSSPRACEHCNAPYERVTEKVGEVDTGKHPKIAGATGSSPTSTFRTGIVSVMRTTGWQATCRCENEGTGRCIVLDPFCGSGTVCAVALEHGRDYIGIDQSAGYLKLAEKRLSEVQPRLF